jgi:hypothetical protein
MFVTKFSSPISKLISVLPSQDWQLKTTLPVALRACDDYQQETYTFQNCAVSHTATFKECTEAPTSAPVTTSPSNSPPSNTKKLNEARKMLQKLSRMNRSQNEKLNKYRSAVQTLREQLEDLNLFNAKLLYVNKLLQNKTLSESEKKSVIKALDEARSLTETKSLYKSLVETFARGTRGSMNESRRYASSSRTTTSSASKGRASGELDRWQTLAGLK